MLSLVDRSLIVGDTVKRSPSDAQSGIIISTSLVCTVQPLCNEIEYSENQHPLAQGQTPSNGPHAPRDKSRREGLVHGFSRPYTSSRSPINSPLDRMKSASPLRVSAQELKYWNSYREEDFIIFDDWVGQVEGVYEEVTVRLANGSLVVVEDPGELEEPYWIPGTNSYELAQRLDRAGFYEHRPKKSSHSVGEPRAVPAEPCYPGQYVRTKKGNLRRGRWKFRAYDPALPPQGIVVDVRCTQLEVRWLYPNQSIPLQSQTNPPTNLLETDELESGRILVYDRSRLPNHLAANQLPDASYSRDIGFGHKMRFKDPAGAAVKYAHASTGSETEDPESRSLQFRLVPRSATQGFDMNVLQVTSTTTTAMVQWQDCNVSIENAIDLKPYLNPDEHDVWPGDKVSYIPGEVQPDDSTSGAIRISKVGVIQRVAAASRIANVRWFNNAGIEMDEGKIWQIPGSRYGEMGDEITEVSLYDIAAHPALSAIRGDGAIILPESPSLSDDNDGSLGLLAAGIQRARGIFEFAAGAFGVVPPPSTALPGQTVPPTVLPPTTSGSTGIDWCGEIIDLCLDGQLLVRLGAAAEVYDIKVPPERVLIVSSDNQDDESAWTDDAEEEEERGWTDEMSLDETDPESDSDKIVDISVEYDEGENFDGDKDSEMWTTDEEDNQELDTYNPEMHHCTPEIETTQASVAPESIRSGLDQAVHFTRHASMPEQFGILEGVPNDHRFIDARRPLTANLMRRIVKENEIMLHSLPDGVFVRTWESRLDLVRVIIVGPHDTPYEFSPFIFDLQYGPQFPTSPPSAFFHSWTGNLGRINPNLYEDGTICLSLLGTWDASKQNEAWSSKDSTILQLIVSLMGLVLVKEPYYSKLALHVFTDEMLPLL